MENGIFSFLKDDWQGIPQNYRYLIFGGSILLFLDWLSEHLGRPYNLFGFDFHQLFFNLGVTLIVAAFVFLLLGLFFSRSILENYRKIYPMDKVNETFALVSFKGNLMLFDKRKPTKKTSYHIATVNTATDLGFWGSELYLDMNYVEALQQGLEIQAPYSVKVKDYKFGGDIKTRN